MTGVQTCALPIFLAISSPSHRAGHPASKPAHLPGLAFRGVLIHPLTVQQQEVNNLFPGPAWNPRTRRRVRPAPGETVFIRQTITRFSQPINYFGGNPLPLALTCDPVGYIQVIIIVRVKECQKASQKRSAFIIIKCKLLNHGPVNAARYAANV